MSLERGAFSGLVHPSSGHLRRAAARGARTSIGFVHVRRALLLFAVVLGLAALAASVSRQPEESRRSAEQPAAGAEAAPEPEASPGVATPSSSPVEVVFEAERDQSRRVDAGQPATVLVKPDQPGLVEIPDLGVTAPADPLTPARFDLLVSEAGRYDIAFTPAGGTSSAAGTLVVRSAAAG
jgi:hypothetical protein